MVKTRWRTINTSGIDGCFHTLSVEDGNIVTWLCRDMFGNERIALRYLHNNGSVEGESICGGTLYDPDGDEWKRDAEQWAEQHLSRHERAEKQQDEYWDAVGKRQDAARFA